MKAQPATSLTGTEESPVIIRTIPESNLTYARRRIKYEGKYCVKLSYNFTRNM